MVPTRVQKGEVAFVTETDRTFFLYVGYSLNVQTSDETVFTGDARSIEEMALLQRSGYRVGVDVLMPEKTPASGNAKAFRVAVTKLPATRRERATLDLSREGNWLGHRTLQPSGKWAYILEPWVKIRDDSEFRSVDAIANAVDGPDTICVYMDSYNVATYFDLVMVVGAWRLPGPNSTANRAACRAKE